MFDWIETSFGCSNVIIHPDKNIGLLARSENVYYDIVNAAKNHRYDEV